MNRSLLICLFLSLAACGPGQFESSGGSLGKGDSLEVQRKEIPTLLGGNYQLLITSVTRSRDKDTDEVSTNTTRLLGHVTAYQAGARADLVVNVCKLLLPNFDGYRPTLDPALYRRLAPIRVEAAIEAAKAPGSYHLRSLSPMPLTLGLDLDDPLKDPVPISSSDSRVVDQDLDGNPGVSVSVGWFEIYAAVRLRASLRATITVPVSAASKPSPSSDADPSDADPSDADTSSAEGDTIADSMTSKPSHANRPKDRISGKLDLAMHQQIYGDNIPFVNAASKAKKAARQYITISKSHRFELKRTQAKTCAGLPLL